MDFTCRGRAWLDKIGEKLESLCSEVEARSQEFVESQWQRVGANLKQFCIEVILDVLPASLPNAQEETSNSSPEQNSEEQHPASELSNISVQEDNKDELSRSNSSSPKLAVESTEGVHVDSAIKPRADKAMKLSVEDWEKVLCFTGKSSAVVASTEETLKRTLYCEGDNGVEVPDESSTIASSVECLEFDPSMQEGKTIDFTDHGPNTSNVPSLTCSIYSTETQESAFPEIISNATLPAVSNGASVEHFVNELASDLIPELEFDENFVLVDKDDLCSGSEFHGARISHKKNMPKSGKQRNKDATKCGDLSVELEQSNAECKLKYDKLEWSQEGFCESDWEIF